MVDRRVARAGSGRAFRPSPVFLGLVALWVTGGAMAWFEYGSPTFNVILFVLAGWVVSLSLHEYAHALYAFHSGDRAVAGRGYLTLNPLKYTHPVLSIGLPLLFLLLGGIGLPGGAVWVDRHAVKGRLNAAMISAVGPGANLVFLLLMIIPFAAGVHTREHQTFWSAVAFLAFLQLTAVVLNLMPIPGVDGGNIIRPYLSPGAGRVFDQIAPFGMLILFGLLFTPITGSLFFTFVDFLSDVVAIPASLWREGYDIITFWR
jgi:Zn-dependent protease